MSNVVFFDMFILMRLSPKVLWKNMKNLPFLKMNFQNSFQGVEYCWILGCQALWYWIGKKRIIYPPHFVNDLSRKIFLMIYFGNRPNFIVRLPLFLYFLGSICIPILSFLGFDVIISEVNLIFLIKLFSHKTKKSRQKFKYLKNKKSF